jgi:spore germination cell wall hydrolase CwlJ-like protein
MLDRRKVFKMKKYFKVLIMYLPLMFISLNTNSKIKPPTLSNITDRNLTEMECIVLNLYHEARSESDEGVLFVLGSMIKRKSSNKYPDTYCKVVYRPWAYSWTMDKLSDAVKDTEQWDRLYKIAAEGLVNPQLTMYNTGRVDHYYADYIDAPFWAKHPDMLFIKQIGVHRFYRWEG